MRQFNVGQICEQALRKIGSFAITDLGADPAEMEQARVSLDMLIGHMTAKGRVWWLVGDGFTFSLNEDEDQYDLNTVIGGQVTTDQVQFIISARLKVPNGGDSMRPISLIGRSEYDAIPDKSRNGQPHSAYVTVSDSPSMFFYPVPEREGYEVEITYQRYAPDVTRLKQQNPAFPIESMNRSWAKYLVTALSSDIGSGPVRQLPMDEIRDLRQQVAELERDLMGFAQQEQPKPNQVQYTDF